MNLTPQVIKSYEIRECVGTGGFGTVYRAYQPVVNREVAIKVIRAEYANHPDFIRRFEAEAQIIARLEHPHIVPLYDYWRDPSGAYLVMRWLPGNLRASLKNGQWTVEATARLLDQIAAGLAVAHRHHIVHRDIKPDNILLDEDQNAYLADFGIAKVLDMSTEASQRQQMVGSPVYMTPEQIRSEAVSPQTDLYSLGVVLYEMLTGSRPFPEATTPTALIHKHLNEPLPSLRLVRTDTPPALDGVIQMATAKNPVARYPDALRLAAAFRAAADLERPSSAQPLPEPLTERELEILRLMVEGCSNNVIAERLFLSAGTVKWYVKQIYAKLDVHSRDQAIERAQSLNLFSEPSALKPTPLARPITPLVESIDEATAIPEAAPVIGENPYKGLQAFQEADAAEFFGREALIDQLIARLGEASPYARFLAVVGPSGSGKSSVVKAGLIPALRRGGLPDSERWYVVTMLPGAHPLEEVELALTRVAALPDLDLLPMLRENPRGLLRAARKVLPDNASQIVLVIDQFEELFTLVENTDEAAHFMDSLYAAVTDAHSPLRVVVTLRADFWDRPLLYPDFSEMISQRNQTVIPLRPDELEQAIVRPAASAGVDVEPGLVAAIVAEVNEQPGALPLLQYALTELFEQRDGRTLTKARYDALGGILGALPRRAESIFSAFNTAEKEAARQLFLRLVTLGEATEDTRRRTLQSELLALKDEAGVMQKVIDAFDQARLLTFDRDPVTRGPTVEVAHEALLREWTRLKGWLEDSRADVRSQRQLAVAASEWVQAKRDASYLLTGSRLTQFEEWQMHTSVALTDTEREFLTASTAEKQRQAQLERERQAREARLRRRIQQAIGVVAAVSLVAAIIGVSLALIATERGNEAERQRIIAQKAAEAYRLTALVNGARAALATTDTDTALALALEANQGDNPPGIAQVILGQAAYRPGTARLFPVKLNMFAVHPSGKLLAALTKDASMWTWSLFDNDQTSSTYGKPLVSSQSWNQDSFYYANPIFSPDGKLAYFSYKYPGKDTGEGFLMNSDSTSPDFKKLNRVFVEDQGQTYLHAAFGADNSTLLLVGCASEIKVSCEKGTVVAWQIDPVNLSLVKVRARAFIQGVAFEIRPAGPSRSQGLISVLDPEGVKYSLALIMLDPTSSDFGRAIHIFENWGIAAISPDGKRAAFANNDRAEYWNLETCQSIRQFETTSGAWISGIEFSPDTKQLLTRSNSSWIDVADVITGKRAQQLKGHNWELNDAHFMPDGQQLLSSAADSTRLWNIQRGDLIQEYKTFIAPFANGGIPRRADFSPDSRLVILTGECDLGGCDAQKTGAAIYNNTTGQEVLRFTGYAIGAMVARFSPDGTKVFISAADTGAGKVWEAASGRLISAIEESKVGSDAPVFGLFNPPVFGADNRTLVAVAANQVVVWDIGQNPARVLKQLPTEPLSSKLINAALSERVDRTLVFASTVSGDILGWDLATGAQVATLKGHTARIRSIAVSTDKRWLLSGGDDNAVILWDINPNSSGFGKLIRRFVGQPTTLFNVSFSPNGRYAFADSYGQGERQWDVETGELVRIYDDLTGSALSPDGRSFIAMGPTSYVVMQLRIDTLDELKAWIIQNRYVRPFTCEERTQYNVEPLPCKSNAGG